MNICGLGESGINFGHHHITLLLNIHRLRLYVEVLIKMAVVLEKVPVKKVMF